MAFMGMNRVVKTAAVSAAAVALFTAFQIPAHANGKDGRCESGEVCLYENRSWQGGLFDDDGWLQDYAGYTFSRTGDPIDNNVASVINNNGSMYWRGWQYKGNSGWHFDVNKRGQCGEGCDHFDRWSELPAGIKNALSSHEWYY
ncbi:peptidase inhibitor family I36 protein [Streptomyces blastmyceticus]|uniref:Peptidase inhibitor family I36 n=1 Tax=Streptomyces blastmyceticus TaxID=68180 RepID=A0ABN0XZM6_9ACTN